MSNSLKIGMRVVRGTDWNWGEQDGGEGHVGTVIDVGSRTDSNLPGGTVVVMWDTGIIANYRAGYEGSYDLRLLDNAATGVRHKGITCHECEQTSFFGFRWKCTSCHDYDLCNTCYMADRHDTSHRFYRIVTPDTTRVLVLARSKSRRILARGIYPGAEVCRRLQSQSGNRYASSSQSGLVTSVIDAPDETCCRCHVTVKWNNGTVSCLRRGYRGEVDVKCKSVGNGEKFYIDLLPELACVEEDIQQRHEHLKLSTEMKTKATTEVYVEVNNDVKTKMKTEVYEDVNTDVKTKATTEVYNEVNTDVKAKTGVKGLISQLGRAAPIKQPISEKQLSKKQSDATQKVPQNENTVQMYVTDEVKLIHSLTENKPINGLTALNNLVYVRYGSYDIDIYDLRTYELQHSLHIPGLGAVCSDMTSCKRHQCIYIGDYNNNVVHRVDSKHTITQWHVTDELRGLSVNSVYNVLVTCYEVGKVMEFTSDGELIREISLDSSIVHPFHTVELTNGQLVVCHGDDNDAVHRVCIIDLSGRVLKSYGGSRGSGSEQLNVPIRLSVNGVVFVSDMYNHRVLMLSPTLSLIREVVSGLRYPRRIWFDDKTGRLYVGDNNWENDQWVSGQVKVYGV